jgi:phospholipase C
MKSRRQFLQAGLGALPALAASGNPSKIEHVVVLMLENRSFDHMLGFSGIPGTEIPPEYKDFTLDNEPIPPNDQGQLSGQFEHDPGHEFLDVMYQMYGQESYCPSATPCMNHFIRSYGKLTRPNAENVIHCQKPTHVPVLATLAKNYALCTRWFSSVPGPTLPNRMFAHLGTSCGRLDMNAFDLDVPPTIYEVLGNAGKSGTIYADGWSVAATFWRLMQHQDRYFGTMDDFYKDCADNRLPAYCFLEPRYGSEQEGDIFRPQNDQHPDSDIAGGDELIYSVYRAIQGNRDLWKKSVLIITYDEHGGTYDHIPPPKAIPPDKCISPGDNQFDFSRYGVRVPAVVVSPYTPKELNPQTWPHKMIENNCDHTSILSAAHLLLTGQPLSDELGARAKAAYPLTDAFDWNQTPRPVHDTDIDFSPPKHIHKPARAMNHLQRSHAIMASKVEERLPKKLRTGITLNENWTDQEAQHYVKRVYMKAARFEHPKNKCHCS